MAKAISNKRQMSKLLQLMECNPDLAKGMYKMDHTKERWKSFANILNSLGPPIKNYERWVKVWVDLKSKAKKKLTQKRAELSSEGQSNFSNLSPRVLAINQILDIGDSTDPLEDNQRSNIIEDSEIVPFSLSDIKQEVEIVNEATASLFENATLSFPSAKCQKFSSGNIQFHQKNLLEAHCKEERKFHKEICNKLESIEFAINMMRYQQREHQKLMKNIEKEKLRLIKESNQKNEKYRTEKLQILRNNKKLGYFLNRFS